MGGRSTRAGQMGVGSLRCAFFKLTVKVGPGVVSRCVYMQAKPCARAHPSWLMTALTLGLWTMGGM